MTRVKRGYVARKRRKNILTLTSGSRGTHSKLFRTANQQGMRALASSHRNRGKKKEIFVVYGLHDLTQQHEIMEFPIIN